MGENKKMPFFEYPFMRDDITPEEFEAERVYYLKTIDEYREKKSATFNYKTLYQQKLEGRWASEEEYRNFLIEFYRQEREKSRKEWANWRKEEHRS